MASCFSAKKCETITSLGSEGERSSKLLFSTPRSLCVLWFLNQLKPRQERALRSTVQGERNDSSHWANIETSGSHQKLIKLVWCLGGRAFVTGGIQSAEQNEPGVFLFASDCHRAAALFYKQHTETSTQRSWYRLRKHLHIVHCNTANSPRNMPKAKQALFSPLAQMIVSHFRLQLPWWHKLTFMRREISDDLKSFSSVAFRW